MAWTWITVTRKQRLFSTPKHLWHFLFLARTIVPLETRMTFPTSGQEQSAKVLICEVPDPQMMTVFYRLFLSQ